MAILEMKANAEKLLKANLEVATRAKNDNGRGFTTEELDMIQANLAQVKSIHASIEALRETEALTASTTPTTTTAPTLIDGGAVKKNFTVLRTVDGHEVRAYGKGQRLSNGAHSGMSLGDFGRGLAAIITGDHSGALHETRNLSENTNTAGGFFVTEELSNEFIDLARAKSQCFNAGTRTIAMNSDTLRIVSATDDVSFSQVGENSLIPSDDPAYGSRLLTAKKHGVLVKCSSELLADGAGAGTAIVNSLAAAWAVYMDSLILSYLMGSTAIDGTGSVGAVDWDDILTAQLAIRTLNGEPTAAIAHPKAINALAKLKEATTNAYLAPPAAVSTITMLPSTNIADTSILVGDFTQAVVGVRSGMTIQTSVEAGDSFAYDQTWIRLLWRGDVGHLLPHFHELSGLTY